MNHLDAKRPSPSAESGLLSASGTRIELADTETSSKKSSSSIQSRTHRRHIRRTCLTRPWRCLGAAHLRPASEESRRPLQNDGASDARRQHRNCNGRKPKGSCCHAVTSARTVFSVPNKHHLVVWIPKIQDTLEKERIRRD